MQITRTSTLTGITRTREIAVTEDQIAKWMTGFLIQVAMPDITTEEREFIMTGTTVEEWDEEFADEA